VNDPFPCQCPPYAECPHEADINGWLDRHPYDLDESEPVGEFPVASDDEFARHPRTAAA
jgi:hypothetical protein